MIAAKMAASGMRLTPQRLAILAFLEGNTGHPSAEDIFDAVRRRYPTMSFATVYNTIEAMKGVGGIQELTIDAARRRYDPNTKRHHHLICRCCGRIVDIHQEFRLEVPAHVSEEFEVIANHVEFFGTCRACRERAAESVGIPPDRTTS